MNRLTTEKRVAVVTALTEGNSINSTCRITRVSQKTVLALLKNVGESCARLHETWVLICRRAA